MLKVLTWGPGPRFVPGGLGCLNDGSRVACHPLVGHNAFDDLEKPQVPGLLFAVRPIKRMGDHVDIPQIVRLPSLRFRVGSNGGNIASFVPARSARIET